MVLIGFVVLNLIASTRRPVHLVNGTAGAYTVEIDGTQQRLTSGTVQTIRLAEGTHTVRLIPDPGNEAAAQVPPAVTGLGPIDTKQTFDITGDWFSWFGATVYVLNPDQTATLINQGVGYGSHTGDSGVLLKPALLHAVSGIDHAFDEPPNSVEVSVGGGKTLQHLFLWETNDLEEIFHGIASEHGPEAARELIERRFLVGPPDTYLTYYRDELLGVSGPEGGPSLKVEAPFRASAPVIPPAPKLDLTAPGKPDPEPAVQRRPALLDWAATPGDAELESALVAWSTGDDAALRALLQGRSTAGDASVRAARLQLAVFDRDAAAAEVVGDELSALHPDPAAYAALDAVFPMPEVIPALVEMAVDPRATVSPGTCRLRALGTDQSELMGWWANDLKQPTPESIAAIDASPPVKAVFFAAMSRLRHVDRGVRDHFAEMSLAALEASGESPALWKTLVDDVLNAG